MISEHNNLVLRDVLIPGGRIADITIENGIVTHIGSSENCNDNIACKGKIVLPAGTDVHVHMRDGPQHEKETWKTGTKSALAGGITVVIDQPNTIPPLTTPDRIKDRVKLAHEQAFCRFAINGAVTADTDLAGIWKEGVFAFGETFAAASSYGEAIDKTTLQNAMTRISAWDGLMTIHAEQVTDGVDDTLISHDLLRSENGEKESVLSVIQQNKSKCRLHFCHLSSPLAIDAISANAATIEVTPHHLFLSRDLFSPDDTRGKVNPPLRSEKTRKSLFSYWDRIQIIASDHAPHTAKEKNQAFHQAPSGIPGIETMIPLLMGWYHEKKIPLTEIIEKTSFNPSQMLGIKSAGFSPGCRADFAIYPDEVTKIESESLHSAANWTPYEGMTAIFPEKTILGGMVVFNEGDFYKMHKTEINNNTDPFTSVLNNNPSLWIPGRGYNLIEHM
ncbi:dihydroorotase [Methanospirillum stamsii]|uniref:Dihydroorotase n=1 Tax=Methanospirillum stamsii TaxID=1277351 RepID=A0A2V2N590_9EURY|nr:dihydroorotase [Methanospirillum stamsii]PWR75242.1 dihydroorotase [Methanospirillum stamsii]